MTARSVLFCLRGVPRSSAPFTLSAGALLLGLLAGCSTTPPPPAAPMTAGSAAAPSAPQVATPGAGPASPPSSTPAFANVVQGAQRQDGLLPLWRKDEKVWLELHPRSFNQPLFFSPKLASGIGEGGLFGGLMQSRWAQVGRPQWVTFRQVHKQVQLLAVNAAYTARAGTPQARAVEAAFSPSLLGSAPVASAPHPETGAVLVELTPMLLSDMLGLGVQLQRTYRQAYALDVRHSTVQSARATPQNVVFEVMQHFASASLVAPAPGVPAGAATNPSTPQAVPDPRSLFLTVHYTLSALPAQAMSPRPADARVGYFTTTVTDFTDDLARSPRRHFINRWRLSKKDPSAPLSPPVQPIVFWLDPSIPEAYRATITEGILVWNRAFEAIGYRNAIEVRVPEPDQRMDTLATGQASIRWMTNAQPRFGAIGPSHVDPRSGEILGADIALESLSSRSIRTVRSQILTSTGPHTAHSEDDAQGASCQHGDLAAEQLALGLDVLTAQGVIDPDSPQVREFVLAYLKDTTMHEVGHTLGLRHNFRASRWRTAQELTHPQLTAEHGISASVMEYSPINLPAPGQSAGAPFQTTLGPYDFWAIAYGYGDLPDAPDQAVASLKALAQRSADPAWADALAYGTDEDNLWGLDPQALTFDLGRDPVAFARTRVAIVRDLLARQAARVLTPTDDPTLLRRSVSYGIRELARTSQTLMRQVGGVITRRDAPGSGRDLLEPLHAATQRQALDMLLHEFLSEQAVSLPPALLRRLAPDYLEREDASGTDFSVAEQLLTVQRAVLNHLMADALAERLQDNADKVRDREPHPLNVAKLYAQLRQSVWTPQAPRPPSHLQRNLQREHVTRLAAGLLRSGGRADVRAVIRQEAATLLHQLQASASTDPATQAHRRACIDILQGALQARVVRAGA